MQKTNKSIEVFKNPILERLTHVHPLTPFFLWMPIVFWLLWRSFTVYELSPFIIGILGVIGFFSWTLVEYLLHRYLFHFEFDSSQGQKFHFLIHGLHHADPDDPTRLVMPPIASIFLGITFFTLFKGVLGIRWAETFFAFFVFGYLCYDYIHFYTHHFIPKSSLGKFLKNSHMLHHYVSPNSRWGVSSPFWDYVFGSMEDIKSKEKVV